MKKTLQIALLCILCILLLASCRVDPPVDDTPDLPDTPSGVSVEAKVDSVTIKDENIAAFDYSALFEIVEDGATVTVPKSAIDKNEVKAEPGEYTVYCTYGGEQATVKVIVLKTVYSLTLSKDSIVLTQKEAESYDFLALFSAEKDGQTVAITDDMIVSNIKNEAGVYEYTVTYGGISRTLTVTVNPNHWVEAIPAYRELPITLEELDQFDFTSLFSLFVDGVPVQVTPDMIDSSALADAKEGETYTVVFAYTYDGTSATGETVLRIVEKEKLTITAKSIVTYPNGAAIDLASLF